METTELNMVRFRIEENSAFKKVFDAHYQSLVHFAFLIINNNEDAEDIAVEALAKVWERFTMFETSSHIKAYLFITVRNDCFNFLKQRKSDINKKNRFEYLFKNEEEPAVFTKMVEVEWIEQGIKLMEYLPAKCKEIYTLHLLGLSHFEISKKLNTSLSNVTSQIHNARKKLPELRKKMDHLF